MQSADLRQDISCRDQYNQLTHDRYDHAEYCFAECLEYGTGNDTEPCDQVVDTDDTKCRNTNLQHVSRCIEHSKQYLWDTLKTEKSDKSKAECSCQTDPDRPDHTLSLLGTVVVSNDRCDTIVQSEYRHEEEALKLKVYTEYGSCGRRKLDQDAVHRIGHD